MGSSNKTKDWLKNQLVSHGVPLPSSAAKKEEYQRLYDEQVLSIQNNSTEFSSDDDTEEPSPQDTPTRSSSVANNSRPDTKTQNGTDKHTSWVHGLSDKNLFTALKANGKEVGGIVASTRFLYENMLVDLLKKNEDSTLSEIDNYLLQADEDTRNNWAQAGVINGVTNGNSSNGFSDSDDDDAVETASRASRSSRASSKRMTPIRSSIASPPAKESTPTTHRTVADSNAKPRRVTEVTRNEELDEIDEADDNQDVPATSSFRSTFMPDSLLYNRVSSLSDTPPRFPKPYTSRKTVTETAEITRSSHRFYEQGTFQDATSRAQLRSAPPKTRRAQITYVLKCIALLLILVGAPVLAYFAYIHFNNSEGCTGPECTSDELDVILQQMDNEQEQGAGGSTDA